MLQKMEINYTAILYTCITNTDQEEIKDLLIEWSNVALLQLQRMNLIMRIHI